MLDGACQRVVEPQIGAVDRFGLGQPPLIHQQGRQCVARRLHPAPGFVVKQPVRGGDRIAQMLHPLVNAAAL